MDAQPPRNAVTRRGGRLRTFYSLAPTIVTIELTANVWPVVDSATGLVLRYFARAYAMDAPDDVISRTLRALAPTDFRVAQVFVIPSNFKFATEFGTLDGCVPISGFHEDRAAILAPAFRSLEQGFARLQGVSLPAANGAPVGLGIIPRFPPDPYLLVTSLLETPDGQLHPQLRA